MALRTEARAGGRDFCRGKEMKESIENYAPSIGIDGLHMGESLRDPGKVGWCL